LDVYKFYIDPCSVLRDRAIEFIDKLESYNEGQSGTPTCPEFFEEDDEEDIILNKIRNFKSGAFDGMYKKDEETGLPSYNLNTKGIITVVSISFGCLCLILLVGYVLKEKTKTTTTDTSSTKEALVEIKETDSLLKK
jgi:hypothetical protein